MAKKYLSLEKMSEFLALIKAKIPTKTSDLTNDSKFITMEQVPKGAVASTTTPKMDGVANVGSENAFARGDHTHPSDTTKVDKVTGKDLSTNDYTTEEKNKLAGIADNANKYELPKATTDTLGGIKIGANITIAADGTISVEALSWANIDGKPTKLSDFTNDSGFITKAVNDLANYYTKTNTYTKTEVNTLIGDLKTISIQKVDNLPTTGQSNIIYLVPASGSTENHYVEYIWVAADSSFEPIGDTKIDLSNYWSKTELIEVTTEDINALFTNW